MQTKHKAPFAAHHLHTSPNDGTTCVQVTMVDTTCVQVKMVSCEWCLVLRMCQRASWSRGQPVSQIKASSTSSDTARPHTSASFCASSLPLPFPLRLHKPRFGSCVCGTTAWLALAPSGLSSTTTSTLPAASAALLLAHGCLPESNECLATEPTLQRKQESMQVGSVVVSTSKLEASLQSPQAP